MRRLRKEPYTDLDGNHLPDANKGDHVAYNVTLDPGQLGVPQWFTFPELKVSLIDYDAVTGVSSAYISTPDVGTFTVRVMSEYGTGKTAETQITEIMLKVM